MHAPHHRRSPRPLLITVLAMLVALGAACGDDSSEVVADPPERTIVHRFGETSVPASPQRIVAVGATDADALLAIDVTPVAAYPNTGFGDGAFFPWLEELDAVDQVEPLPLTDTFTVNIEQVAALDPDLILAVNMYTDAEAQYEALSEIAPTVASSVDPVDLGWDEQALEIGRALGREDDARRVVDEVRSQVDAAREAHPEFAGKTLAFGGVFDPTAATMVFGEEDYSRVFLSELGFTVPPVQLEELASMAPDGETQADVGLERLDLLDADALVLAYLDPAVEVEFTGRDVFQRIPVVSDGRYVATDAGTIAALRLPSVVAVPFVLDRLVPELAEVLDR